MTTFKSGQWNAICDVCGFKLKSNQLRKRWDGLMVCEADFERKHPQLFVKTRTDRIVPPWVRPDVDVFVFSCTPTTSQGVADVGTADCARADNTDGPPVPTGISAISGIAVSGISISGLVY